MSYVQLQGFLIGVCVCTAPRMSYVQMQEFSLLYVCAEPGGHHHKTIQFASPELLAAYHRSGKQMETSEDGERKQKGDKIAKSTKAMLKVFCTLLEPNAVKRLSAENMPRTERLRHAAGEPLPACPVNVS